MEAVRGTGPSYVVGVQWHPEFVAEGQGLDSPEPLVAEFLAATGPA